MTLRPHISSSISRLIVSLLMLFVGIGSTQAQITKMFKMEKDSIPLFCGFSVSFDLVGPAMMMMTSHGEYEGALRVNLHDQWFPIFELGLGRANHENDEVTGLSYKTAAPYYRVGMDWNLLKQKHGPNRLYGGFRYAYTNYQFDLFCPGVTDPTWGESAEFKAQDVACNYHWLEFVFGVDAKIWGPIRRGWSARYKRRLFHDDGNIGNTWYVPGYGIGGNARLGGTFNVIFEL